MNALVLLLVVSQAPTAPAAKPSAPAPAVVLPPAPAVPASPLGLPAVDDSADNPTTPEKVALGHALFFDKRLSKDDSMGCVACHLPEKAYTSGNAVDAKVGGALNKRNSPTMLNLAFHREYYWDGRKPTLEAVSAAAWTGQLGAEPAAVSAKLAAIPTYKAMFQAAFKADPSADTVPKALAAFFRALKSGSSAWDKAQAGDKKALSAEAKAGEKLFAAKGCIACHTPPLFSDFSYHAVGIGSEAADDAKDHGRKDATKAEEDEGKFKTPSLRNVALTGPYFHDGKTATLEEAIGYMAGGFKKAKGPVDPLLKEQKLSKKEVAALKAYLTALSGESTFPAAPALP